MSIRESSIEAYHELKEEGKISEKQSKAFEALKAYAEHAESDKWPTKVELYEWAQGYFDNEDFPFSRFGNFKPRITELTVGYENTDFELLEYLDEKREQDSVTTERKAKPVKIKSFQSTLSSENGEAAELEDEEGSESSASTGSERPGRDIEIPFSVNDGSEVRMAGPEEAIAQTDDLDEVEEMLEAKSLLSEYQDDIEAVRSDKEESSSGDVDEVDEGDFVEKESRKYVFDPGESEEDAEADEPGETDDDLEEDDNDDSDEQKVLMRDGEVVV